MDFHHTKTEVSNRGIPPDSFLEELIAWSRDADDDIFTENNRHDIYASVRDVLGPYTDLQYRRAVMIEVLRVLAGFESSWKWNEGVDTSAPKNRKPDEIEAGAWQVSANSMRFHESLSALVFETLGSVEPQAFQRGMKENHELAMEYIARLLRITISANGPIVRKEIHQFLRRQAVQEFKSFLND